MEAGATNLSDLYQRALSRRSFEGVRYWGAGLSHIQRNGRMIWTSLSIADRQESGYAGNDDADLINILQNVDESTIAVIFVEQPNGKVKVSWRAQPGFDVSALALSFGGGGHAAAAGVEVVGTLDEVQDKILKATEKVLSNNHGSHSNPAANSHTS
jgi:phosphoesterase RecJ-like protein